MKPTDKVAFVTRPSGIGAATALRLAAAGAVSEKEAFVGFGSAHPVGRIGEPEEVAELIACLVSDRAGFVTGPDLRIDAG